MEKGSHSRTRQRGSWENDALRGENRQLREQLQEFKSFSKEIAKDLLMRRLTTLYDALNIEGEFGFKTLEINSGPIYPNTFAMEGLDGAFSEVLEESNPGGKMVITVEKEGKVIIKNPQTGFTVSFDIDGPSSYNLFTDCSVDMTSRTTSSVREAAYQRHIELRSQGVSTWDIKNSLAILNVLDILARHQDFIK